jgi:hypothetical protein
MGRYTAVPGNPPQVWDSWKSVVIATHIRFSAAVSQAYTLNQFSTGVHAGLHLVKGGRA